MGEMMNNMLSTGDVLDIMIIVQGRLASFDSIKIETINCIV